MPSKKTRRKRFEVKRLDRTTGDVVSGHALLYPDDNGNVQSHHFEMFNDERYSIVSIKPVPRKKRTMRPRHGWDIDYAALQRAISELEIELPVVLDMNSRSGTTDGSHMLKTASTARQGVILPVGTRVFHRIMLKSYLSADRAGEVAWHELAHAAQAERAIRAKFGPEWTQRPRVPVNEVINAWLKHPSQGYRVGKKRRSRYRSRPIEVEARAAEKRNNDIRIAVDKPKIAR